MEPAQPRPPPGFTVAAIFILVAGIAATTTVFSIVDTTVLETGIISAFGVDAVALAMIGLYGLVALAVTTRRREIGIRIALDAEPRRVVGVAPLDPLTLGAAVLALGVADGVAALVPASRAAKIDPVDAIRESE